MDGHRPCQVCFSPHETRAHHGRCPQCGKKITVGVLHRIEALADRDPLYIPPAPIPAQHLLPLEEIIAAAVSQRTNTKKVTVEYDRLLERYGSELSILLERTAKELADGTPPQIVEGILKVRRGEVQITPGYDGEYGKIGLFA